MWFVDWVFLTAYDKHTGCSPARDKHKDQSVAMRAIALSHKINCIQQVTADSSTDPSNTSFSLGDPSFLVKQVSEAEMHLDINTL